LVFILIFLWILFICPGIRSVSTAALTAAVLAYSVLLVENVFAFLPTAKFNPFIRFVFNGFTK